MTGSGMKRITFGARRAETSDPVMLIQRSGTAQVSVDRAVTR